jgi:MobA/VirD2-like, nuclease domain
VIAKGDPHGNGAKLARYLITGRNGERAELVELRGLSTGNIHTAFAAVELQASATRCIKPFFHAYVRLPAGEGLNRDQWKTVADRIERQLGFTGQGRAIAFHHQPAGDTHMHIAWSRIDLERQRARDPGLHKNKLKEISRQLEYELGLTRVSSERPAGSKARAPGRKEFEQARRLGTDVAGIRETIRACFDAAENGRSFAASLASHGLVLAHGERRDFVVVDHAGGLHALSKRITGATVAQIRTHLADLNPAILPGVSQAKIQQAESPEPGDTYLPVAAGNAVRLDPVTPSRAAASMANYIVIPSRPPASAPAIIGALPPAPDATEPQQSSLQNIERRTYGIASLCGKARPGASARKSWKLAARKLAQREPAAPKPRRRRRGEMRGTFRVAAVMTIRQAIELVSFARAGSFLSDTLDWLNLWNDNAAQTENDFHSSEETHLSLHL